MDLDALPDLPRPLASVPYDQRWELLKPAIERLYIGENVKLHGIAEAIKERYKFKAA